MNYKDIDNIVWLIPIRKFRDSLRKYMIKIVKDNEFIKFQNNFIIERLLLTNKSKVSLPEKELNINDLSDFWKKYNEINESYNEVCIYLGIDSGFFSEFNILTLTILYCLVNKIKFKLSMRNCLGFPSDKNSNGWREFFMPFCNELIYDTNAKFGYTLDFSRNNIKQLPSIVKKMYGINYFIYNNSYMINKMRNNDFLNSHFIIKELGIDGDFRHAFGIIAKNMFRFNNETKKEIDKLIKSLNLPKKYIGFYMRGGDKIMEAELVEPEKYIERLKEHSEIKDIFISSDDYGIIKKLQDKHGNEYNIYTLDKNKTGFHLYDFLSLTEEDKHNHNIKFLASIEILLNSELCFGTYTSNPSSFLGAVLGKEKFIDVDYNDFFIM